MKAISFLLLFFVSQLFSGTYYVNSMISVYDLEQNLLDPVNDYTTAIAGGSPSYVSGSGVWSGTYGWSTAANAGVYMSVPSTAINAAEGTIEFSWRTPASFSNSTGLMCAQKSTNSRALELYYFSGILYLFNNAGVNTGLIGVSTNTNYYIKMTWKASTSSWAIWTGSWTVPGTVTLTKVYDNTTLYTAGTFTGWLFQRNGQGNPSAGGVIDKITFRNVYDNTATVTADLTYPQGWTTVSGSTKIQ